jgi:tetratricopeptide (TPR) repeat protein
MHESENPPSGNGIIKQGQLVIILSSDINFRNVVRKCLRLIEIDIELVSHFNDCFPILASKKPFALIHDWDSFQQSQNVFFQGRIHRMKEYDFLHRFVVSKEISVILVAQCCDYNVRKALKLSTIATSLPQEMQQLGTIDIQQDIAIRQLKRLRGTSITDGSEKYQNALESAYRSFGHDPQVALEYGGYKLLQNQVPEAMKICEDLLKQDPNNVRAMNLSARCHCKIGNLDKGLEILEAANELSPQNVGRLVNMGELYFTKGVMGKAKRMFSEALNVDAKDPDALKGLAGVYIEENQTSQALDILMEGISEEETAGYFNNIGVSKVKAGDFKSAIQLYETAIQGLKSNLLKSVVFYNIGLALKKEGKFEDAKRAFQESLNLNPDNEKSKSNLAQLHKKEN